MARKKTKDNDSQSFERQMQRNRRLIGHGYHDFDDQHLADECVLTEVRDSLNANGSLRGFNF